MANKNMSAFMKMIIEAENNAMRQSQMLPIFKSAAFQNLKSVANTGILYNQEPETISETQISMDDLSKKDTSWGSMVDESYSAEGVCDDHIHPDLAANQTALKKKAVHRIIGKLNPAEMRRAVILSEILSPPVSVRNK